MAGKEGGCNSGFKPVIWSEEERKYYFRETLRVYPLISSNPCFHTVIENTAVIIDKASQETYTNKAIAVSVLGLSLPEEIRIKQKVFSPDQTEEISLAIHEAIGKGKDVGIRTSFSGKNGVSQMGRAPWIMGLNNHEDAETFLNETYVSGKPNWRGSHETFRQWQGKYYPGLSEIIVMENPAGLGEKELRDKHFVFRLDVSSGELRIELCLGTDQLRSLDESATRSRLIEIKAKIPQRSHGIFYLEDVTVAPGKNYVRRKELKNKKEKEGSFIWNEESGQNILKKKPYKIVKHIIAKFFNEWPHEKEENNFYYRIMALQRFGYGMIEFQGRYNEKGDVQWMLAYGLRGTAESSILRQKKTEYSGD